MSMMQMSMASNEYDVIFRNNPAQYETNTYYVRFDSYFHRIYTHILTYTFFSYLKLSSSFKNKRFRKNIY